MAAGGGPFESGASFGPYTVLGRLGAGGMGEVYRARDRKLQRDVAVKVMRSEFAAHPERLARFEREARLLAALNHPHVASIYGFEEPGGSPALIMELVEGPTLADRLLGGPLPVDDALGIARQIAEAVEYAHEQGIVHRDLKPANVKVAPGDSVKVLDFGLAKALEPDPAAAQLSNSPTLTMPTQAGVMLGTAAYMAPEQAKGRPVDRRADIWAFGCVLYEMVAGTPAFRGETVTDVLAAVIREDPDWSRLPPGIPPRLREVLRRCLTKDLRQRVQAIGDVRIALEEIAAGDRATEPVPRAFSWTGWAAAAAAGGAVVAAIAVLLPLTVTSGSLPPPQSVTRFTVTLPAGEYLTALDRPAIALSPDGRLLAYVAGTEASATPKAYVRRMDSLESRAVRGTDGASHPFFSPDGQWLGFFADGKLKKVPVAGGDAQILAEVVNPVGASWSAGSILVAPYGSPIQRLNDTGGALETMAHFQPTEILQTSPEWLPGGQSALFTTHFIDRQAIVVLGPRPTDRHEILRAPAIMPRYEPTGHLVYLAGEGLMAVPFDLQHQRLETGAPPTLVLKGVYPLQYSLSGTGTLAYVAGHAPARRRRLVWVGRNGVAEPLPGAPVGSYNQPRLSPDGRWIAVDVVQPFGMQVWLYDLAQDTFKPLTFEGVNRHAIWSPDSKRLVYMAQKTGVARLVSQPTNQSREPEPLTTNDAPDEASLLKIPYSISAGGLAIFVKLLPSRNAEIWSTSAVPSSAGSASSGVARRIMEARTADGGPQLSPDGRWLAYASDESGSGREVYVRAFPGPGGPWQASVGGGNEPQWNPRGGELFYRNGDRMMAVPVDTTAGFSAGKPHELFKGNYAPSHGGYVRANYDVSPDGRRFLMLQPADAGATPPSQITVVLNWSEELKRLVPVRPN
jgi:serine/threonine-protein kinase